MSDDVFYLDTSFPNMYFYELKAVWKNGKSFHWKDGQMIHLNHFCFKVPFKKKKPYLYIFIFREVDE